MADLILFLKVSYTMIAYDIEAISKLNIFTSQDGYAGHENSQKSPDREGEQSQCKESRTKSFTGRLQASNWNFKLFKLSKKLGNEKISFTGCLQASMHKLSGNTTTCQCKIIQSAKSDMKG